MGGGGKGKKDCLRSLLFLSRYPLSMLKGSISCSGCLYNNTSRIQTRELGSWIRSKLSPTPTPPPPTTSTAPVEEIASPPIASTSKLLPGAPKQWDPTPLKPLLRKYEDQRQPPTRREPKPSTTSHATLKQSLTDHLQAKRPRHALYLFAYALTQPTSSPLPPRTLALLDLFFVWDYPSIALEAVEDLHKRGYKIPPEISVKLLRGPAINDLILDSPRFENVVEWMKESLGAEDANVEGQRITAENLVYTVLEVLKRLRHPEWAENVFKAYRERLPKGEVGSPRLWALLMRIQGQDGDLATARATFNAWRVLWNSQNPPLSTDQDSPATPRTPPELPYLSMLELLTNHTASSRLSSPSHYNPRSRNTPRSLNDTPTAPYDFLALLAQDRLPPSTDFFASLLRLELSRRRYSVFWQIFRRIDAVGLRRNQRIWLLAIKARLWEEGPGRLARGHSIHQGPEVVSSRQLLRVFLAQSKEETRGRQHLNLNLRIDGGAVMSTQVLNAFLKLFVQGRDFVATGIVLECFGVHRVEPNETTHGTVVIGVVTHWEKGRIKEQLEEGRGMRGGSLGRRGRTRGSSWEEGLRGVELVRRILETRKMRIGLWTTPQRSSSEGMPEEVPGDEVTAPSLPEPEMPTPFWMLTRELRDTSYLTSLLRRCEGLDEEGWDKATREFREQVLPARPRKRKVNQKQHPILSPRGVGR